MLGENTPSDCHESSRQQVVAHFPDNFQRKAVSVTGSSISTNCAAHLNDEDFYLIQL